MKGKVILELAPPAGKEISVQTHQYLRTKSGKLIYKTYTGSIRPERLQIVQSDFGYFFYTTYCLFVENFQFPFLPHHIYALRPYDPIKQKVNLQLLKARIATEMLKIRNFDQRIIAPKQNVANWHTNAKF